MRSLSFMRLSSACLVLLCGLVVVASAQTFLQKGCSSSNCGSCSSGDCQCEELVQGSCYLTQTGGSGIGWCKAGHIKLRSFFVSSNCSGPFAEMDTPLDQCYPAQFSGWVEYECPESYAKDHPAKALVKKTDAALVLQRPGRVELKLPGPKFVPHEDSFDLSKHAPHVGVHQTFEGEVLTLKLGEAASHRRTPTWELRVGHNQPRLLGHSTVLNTTQLLQEAKGGSVTLRERNGKSNLYVLRK